VFRNCPLIKEDRRRYWWNPVWRRDLQNEWWDTFNRGVMEPRSKFNPAEPGPHDRFIPWDDTPEAGERWVKRFLESGGQDVSG
jgi:hypothetical protein